ncbi:hypothetical protein ES332_D09G074400v1 [Gossypium tomentosum]|uniref:Uncharacterized protein n=1 Tax=Gossypium tomentosum TaxID=34277 RepID=A0A5D2JFA5_GOSTO|nr:hypothetical protein ES332_D09G074400v1 [Gossypium tomentosum]
MDPNPNVLLNENDHIASIVHKVYMASILVSSQLIVFYSRPFLPPSSHEVP